MVAQPPLNTAGQISSISYQLVTAAILPPRFQVWQALTPRPETLMLGLL